MARLAPKTDVLRALFARSGNQCAFPGCTQMLINGNNKFIAQVCHIEGALEGGERFNPDKNDEQRRSYDNLVLLCYPHHIETNEVDEYPVERLLQIKIMHEQLYFKSDFKVDEVELYKISYEMEKYWSDIDRLNKLDHIFSDSGLAMEVEGGSSFFDVIKSAYDSVSGIENLLKRLHKSDDSLMSDLDSLLNRKDIPPEIFNDIPYYENPFVNRNWESHNLSSNNCIQRLKIDLVHIKIKYFEEYMKTHHDDLQAKIAFEKTKEELKKYAKTAMYVD